MPDPMWPHLPSQTKDNAPWAKRGPQDRIDLAGAMYGRPQPKAPKNWAEYCWQLAGLRKIDAKSK